MVEIKHELNSSNNSMPSSTPTKNAAAAQLPQDARRSITEKQSQQSQPKTLFRQVKQEKLSPVRKQQQQQRLLSPAKQQQEQKQQQGQRTNPQLKPQATPAEQKKVVPSRSKRTVEEATAPVVSTMTTEECDEILASLQTAKTPTTTIMQAISASGKDKSAAATTNTLDGQNKKLTAKKRTPSATTGDEEPGTSAAVLSEVEVEEDVGTGGEDGEEEQKRQAKHRRKLGPNRRSRRKSKSKSVEPSGPTTAPPQAGGTGTIADEQQQPHPTIGIGTSAAGGGGNIGIGGNTRIPISKPKCKINYEEAKQFLDDPLVEEMVEHRHITLGWKHAGNIAQIISRLMESTVGQFRPQVAGVPIAVGEVHIVRPIFIVEQHNCMHVDADVQMIVFKVQPGEPVPGEGVKQIHCQFHYTMARGVQGTAYGNLGMVCHPAPPAHLAPGEHFTARFMGVTFRKALCQIEVAPLGIRRFDTT